jgi:adenylyltransferase/sulfurtransferase
MAGRLMLYDSLSGSFRTVKFKRNPECPLCGDAPQIQAVS